MAPPAPRECNQPARSALHRNQFAAHRLAHRIPYSAAHCIATSSQRIGSRIASRAAQRIASHPVHRSALHRILYSAAHRANATSPRASARASQTIRAPTTNPPRIAHRAR
jgi:hypothetical protein